MLYVDSDALKRTILIKYLKQQMLSKVLEGPIGIQSASIADSPTRRLLLPRNSYPFRIDFSCSSDTA